MQKITITTDSYGDGFDWYFDDDWLKDNIIIVVNEYRSYSRSSDITFGKDYELYEKASNAISYLNDINNYSYPEDDWQGSMDNVLVVDGWVYDIEDYANDVGISIEDATEIARGIVENDEYLEDDAETIARVLSLITGDEFDVSRIVGYSQGDVAYVVYRKSALDSNTLDNIESFYWGGYYDVHVEDTEGEDYWGYMPSYPAKIEDLENWVDVSVTPDTIIIDEAGSGLGQNEDMEDMWDESEDRLDRTTYDPRHWGNEYDLDTISKINESRRLRRSKRVMSSSRLHPSRRRSVKASRSVRRGRR